MPKGTVLAEFEKGEIKAHRENGLSIREIARKIGRSKTVVHNYLQLSEKYGSKTRSGRPTSVDERVKRHIIRVGSNTCSSAADIKAKLDLQISVRRVQQILHHDGGLKYINRTHSTNLKPHHVKSRIEFAEKYQFWQEEWRSVIFSDEKKFNLDGPDGNQKYWHHPSHQLLTRKTRNFGGGSLMVWGGISYCGKTPICFISTKMNAQKYVELLDNVLIDYGDNVVGCNWTFQQDNAAVHTAKYTKKIFSSRGISVLDWPAISPDLNPVENVWGMLTNAIYKNNTQFDSARDLKQAIIREWNNVDVRELHKLVDSMPRRLQMVIIKKGEHISY